MSVSIKSLVSFLCHKDEIPSCAEDSYEELIENPERYAFKGDEESSDDGKGNGKKKDPVKNYLETVEESAMDEDSSDPFGKNNLWKSDMMRHDLKYHPNGYNPDKERCKYREERAKGDISDNLDPENVEGETVQGKDDFGLDENGHKRVDVEAVRERVAQYFEKAGISRDSEPFKNYMACGMGFIESPASTKFHLSTKGGLAQHSLNIVDNMLKTSEAMGVKWPRPESPYLIGLLHDACKCYSYVPNTSDDFEERKKSPYLYQKPPEQYAGHGDASVKIAKDLGFDLLPEEESAIRWHMGAWGLDKDGMKAYNVALSENPLMHICVHTADMMAAKADEAEM